MRSTGQTRATLRQATSRGFALVVCVGVLIGSGQFPSAGPTPLASASTSDIGSRSGSVRGSLALTSGKGVWPLSPRPRVVHGFAPPSVRWRAGHRGVDLSGRAGSPVHSATPGTVIFAGKIAGKGVVVIDIGGGRRTTHEPVAKSVKVGQKVRAGQVIGTLGLASGHCLPAACLHWGLIQGKRYLNPLQLIGFQPIRLYPVR